jgi:DNA-3-methyladenine glycosylase II
MVMNKKIIVHFRAVDTHIASLLQTIGLIEIEKSDDYFFSLCREIIGQQLSGKAADSIHKRFLTLFPKNKVTPERIAALSDEQIRNIGTSWAKVRSLKDLAQKTISKQLNLENIDSLDDQEVISHLTQVKGIGPWTAEMFLMFTLGRQDIFSFGDLGLKKAIKNLYSLKKEPSLKYLQKLTKRWSPYRTYAALLLWKSLEL